MSNSFFQFIQFTIHQDRCAMKVSTDACILGSYVMLPDESRHVLDIGTGTGILSLMIAQRFPNVLIDAVELDENAALQAHENIQASPFAKQIQVIQSDVTIFTSEKKYDFIISNPPYFEHDLQTDNDALNQAKHSTKLDLKQLFEACDKLGHSSTVVAIIIPYYRLQSTFFLANDSGFFPNKICNIRHNLNKKFTTSIVIFNRKKSVIRDEILNIKNENNEYTLEMKNLIKNYYLNIDN